MHMTKIIATTDNATSPKGVRYKHKKVFMVIIFIKLTMQTNLCQN